ncbi:MAG: MCE family protein [Chitinophagaceae bacterium]|nr:MCE family protein [Chitinophagaceae bacterium]
MKISNETKVGILTAISITLLILGFNYLKGKDLIDSSKKLHTVFKKVDGLGNSNAVVINGLQVGTVYKLQEKNKNLDSVIVTINMDKDINIPTNSVATINKDLLGTAVLTITLGNSGILAKDDDTLGTQITAGMLDDVKASLNPAINSVTGTLNSMDSLIQIIGTYFDPSTKDNFQKIIVNLNTSSLALTRLLDEQSSSLAKTLKNTESVTSNLASNNNHITKSLENLETTTGKLANAKIEETVASLQSTASSLSDIVRKVNSNDGTLGSLLNDKTLYRNLTSTTYKINILLDDLRSHPKRYVNISVFGKKNTSAPLTAPLIDDSTSKSLRK